MVTWFHSPSTSLECHCSFKTGNEEIPLLLFYSKIIITPLLTLSTDMDLLKIYCTVVPRCNCVVLRIFFGAIFHVFLFVCLFLQFFCSFLPVINSQGKHTSKVFITDVRCHQQPPKENKNLP